MMLFMKLFLTIRMNINTFMKRNKFKEFEVFQDKFGSEIIVFSGLKGFAVYSNGNVQFQEFNDSVERNMEYGKAVAENNFGNISKLRSQTNFCFEFIV